MTSLLMVTIGTLGVNQDYSDVPNLANVRLGFVTVLNFVN